MPSQLHTVLVCPVSLVVVTLDEPTAAWARRPIGDGNLGGVQLAPIVLGPEQIPAEPPPAPEPELALLSLLAHSEDEHVAPLAEAALRSLEGLAPDQGKIYYQFIHGIVRQAIDKGLLERKVMEKIQDKYQGYFQSLYDEGEAKGAAGGLLLVLRGRGLPVDAPAEQRVLSCTDRRVLERWLRRAGVVQSVEELFQEE